jgi:hypothetical protein
VDLCRQIDPALIEITPAHRVACFAYATAEELGVSADALPSLEGTW